MTTKQKCKITTVKTIQEYIQECDRNSVSKTLICRMIGVHGEYWKNILSQITIDNELTQPMKETLKQTINNLGINSHDKIDVKDLVKSQLGIRVTFIINMLLKTVEKSIILNSGFETKDIQTCVKSIKDLTKDLNDELIKLNTELDSKTKKYNLNDLSKIFLLLFDYIEIVFEITSSIGYGKKSGSLLKTSTYLSKFINWKITPCIHRMYYLFYDLFKKYGLTVKLLTPDCQDTDTGGKRELKLGKCKQIDLTEESPRIKDLLNHNPSLVGGGSCEDVNMDLSCNNLSEDKYIDCFFKQCVAASKSEENTHCKIIPRLPPGAEESNNESKLREKITVFSCHTVDLRLDSKARYNADMEKQKEPIGLDEWAGITGRWRDELSKIEQDISTHINDEARDLANQREAAEKVAAEDEEGE